MDTSTLHRKLSTYLSEKGRLSNVSEEVLFEIPLAWEGWQGTAKAFYKELGFSHRQMAKIIGKAKKLKREGRFGDANFKEIQVQNDKQITAQFTGQFIEIAWGDGKIIRFGQVDQLLEFIKKAS